MLNRVIVKIDGFDYTVVSDESEEYIRKNAALVDQKINEIKASSSFSSMTSAVLAAMNIADKYYKSQEVCDNMRAQIRSYSDECARLRAECSRMKKSQSGKDNG